MKKASTVTFSQDQIVITGNKSPLFTRILLLVIAIIAIIIPLSVIIYRAVDGLGFHFVFVPIILITLGTAYFMLRMFLWNTYGKEILTFTEDGITYKSDYKYFKGSTIIVPKSPNVQFSRHNKEEATCLFSIENKESRIENVLPISEHDLQKIKQEIDQYCRS
ncbi:hypothetical protein [uncultured Kordia sp.]|uniref:hypothetical protein n=1 Tax=uncultured Kordia sp. TaxID=507699 RepID=UPI0026117B33|nr:hypothetical protein [uncultured Kordia sp.]